MDRISWLDYGKCICMLLVIFSHTCIYSTGHTNVFLELLLPTRLVVFFFISGYLIKLESFDFKKTMTSIIKKLLFPYFLFTTIIYIPKHLASGAEFGIQAMFIDIVGGYASWFVEALAVSKILLSVCLKYTKKLSFIGLFCILLTILGFLITNYVDADIPWYANYGLISLVYLFPGMIYKKYESKLDKYPVYQSVISVLLYIGCVTLDYFYFHTSTYIYKLGFGDVSFLGVLGYLLLSFLGIWMMISLVKLIPSGVTWMSYIGRNSLTYYYLNTGLLVALIAILPKIGITYVGTNWFIFPLFIVVVVILTIISQIILRYAPWMVGNFKKSKK